MSEDDLAFHDARGVDDNAGRVPGDRTLRGVARGRVETARDGVTIDWTSSYAPSCNRREP